MGDAKVLLQMLEPAVRPIDRPGEGGRSQQPAPIEQQSFEQLLADTLAETDQPDAAEAGAAEKQATRPDPLRPLANLTNVENASLRDLLSR